MFSQKIDTQIVVTVLNLHIKNYNCSFYVDNERDEYILPQQLDLYVKLNNRHLTLKLLCMIKILSILDKKYKMHMCKGCYKYSLYTSCDQIRNS